ncbi:hypothetical protein FACS189429_0090 [Bacteroidia bacterium]|nr:hypothetical protein FACS189429_0090 [Bacteroidia bacterium]
MRLLRALLEKGQGMLRVQTLQVSSGLEDQYCNAQVKIAFSLPVCGDAPFDLDEKEFFGSGIAAATWSQALSPCLGDSSQVVRGDG